MPTSLFIEHHANGLAFYINGDLQFDTADEAIYHEYLVIPAIALAADRFPTTPLRVLIAGGGDGLAARDVLRLAQVETIDLVDYNPQVLELGRTVFQPYNQSSLLEESTATLGASRVTVYTQDAWDFVSRLPTACYHAVICDFTYPTCAEDSRVYSREWFQQLRRVLYPGGVISTNGVSPENKTAAFWCLYQTMLAADLDAKPLQLAIPSFHRHGYGDWGFFIASSRAIHRTEIEAIQFPANVEVIQHQSLLQAFVIDGAIAQQRHSVAITVWDNPQLFYYLLNSSAPVQPLTCSTESTMEPTINFLEIQETGNGLIQAFNPLELDAIASVWLNHFKQSSELTQTPSDLSQLFPVQHRYHSPKMTQERLGYLKEILAEIDPNLVVKSLLERASELPPQVVRDLKDWAEKIRTGQPMTYFSDHTTEVFIILSATVFMANLTAPDAVFAKGYPGGSYSGGSYTGDSSAGDGHFSWLGFWMTAIGGSWLWSLYRNRDDS
jgi:spermidine synthase